MRNMLVESQETSDRCSAAHKDAYCSQSLINKPLEERRFPDRGSTPIFFSELRYWENRQTGLPKSSRLSELGAFVLLRRCVKAQWSESCPDLQDFIIIQDDVCNSMKYGFKFENGEHYTETQATQFFSQEKNFNTNKLECCKYNIQCIPVVLLNILMSNIFFFHFTLTAFFT